LTVHEQGKPPETPTIAKLDAAQAGGNISDLGGYYREVRAFLRGIETGAPVARATPESSRQSLAVVLEEIAQVLATAH
jgi:predicted dehydrogenase